jgi:type II secretory pathway predicted ATPase ExeA
LIDCAAQGQVVRTRAAFDPFELEPSTAFYIPRPATVQALAALQASIENDEPMVLLCGPPGIGKTLLLRLLRRRIEGRMSCVVLDAGEGESAEALCASALRALDGPSAGSPVEELARASADRGRGVLLLIDRAESLPAEDAQRLLELAARCPSLQIVLAAERPARDHAWLQSPDPRIALVELCQPMSPREVVEYLHARLDLAVAPADMRRRLDWRSWPQLVRESRGNPALLHHLAHRRLEGAGALEPPARLLSLPRQGRAPAHWPWLALGGSALALLGVLALLALRQRAPELRPSPAPAAATKRAAEPPAPAQRAMPAAPAAPGPEVLRSGPQPQGSGSPPASLAPVEAAAPDPQPESSAPPPPAPPEAPASPARTPESDRAAEAAASAEDPAAAASRREAPPARTPRIEPVETERDPTPRASPAAHAALPAASPPAASIPVFVNAVPSARIAIDGRDVGSTPIVGLRIPQGNRQFVASFEDGRRVERSVEVAGSEVYVLFP